MTQAAKFTFENLELAKGKMRGSASEPPKKRTLTVAQIKEIEDAAFSAGLSAGEQAALLRIERQAEASLEQIFAQCSTLMSAVSEQVCLLRGHSAELALLIAKKLASALIAEKPTAEVEKLFLSCVANLNAEPRIVIRVSEELVDILKEKIDHMARKTGYPGRVVLIGDPDSRPAECQIEWADGGVTYRSSQQLELIDQMIAEYVSGTIQEKKGEDEVSFDPDFSEN
ncbi:MAG: hypothetical protein ACSLFL_00905 [Alphaproteobacteria bacterium]